jgi:hypothetical protein
MRPKVGVFQTGIRAGPIIDPAPACGVPNYCLCAFRVLRADDTVSLNRVVRADRPAVAESHQGGLKLPEPDESF